jgi:eukaryotic-like serine/threonine-protein kinase
LLRHKAVTTSLAVLLIVSVGFIFKVLASERKATRHAEIAMANEQRANENAEQTRRALKTSQIALAEAAYRTADLAGMARALDSVPEDLRDQRWDYLSVKRDASLGEFKLPGFADTRAVKAIPGQAGQFAIANGAGTVAIVDVRSGAVLRRIMTDLQGDMVLGVSDDGLRLAVTSRNAAEVKLYRVADGVAEKTLPSPSAAVVRLTFSPDAQQLAVMDEKGEPIRDSRLFLLDLREGSVRWQYSGCYSNAIFSPDGSRLFIGSSRSRRFNVLDTETGGLISQTREYIRCMAMSRDRGRLALGLYSGEVVIIDTATGTEKRRARLHLGGITHIAWTAGDHLLTIGNEAGFEEGTPVMRLWETDSFSSRGTFFGIKEGRPNRGFDFHPSSGHLLLLDSPPQLWRIPADVEAARLSCENAEQGWSTCFLSDTVLLSRTDYALQSFDVTNPSQPKALSFRSPPGYVMSAVHLPSGTAAVARRINAAPHSIKLYQTQESKLTELREIAMPDWTSRIDFDPAGKRLIATTTNQTAMVLDVSSGKTLLKLPKKIERAVFVGKDGDRIAAIVAKKRETDDVVDELTLFDATSGKVLKSTTHHLRLDELVVSPDRSLIAIGGAEQVIRVLDADTLEERIDFRAHDAEISALAFHPKLPQLASASPDGTVKLWDYTTAKLQHTFLGFDGTPIMLAFSPNGRLLSVETQERTARLFDLSGESAPAVVKPAVRAPFPVVGEDWLGLIDTLTEDDIIDEGRGWRRESGALYSPDRGPAVLPLTVNLAGMSYQMQVRFRQLVAREVLHFVLPVGDRMVGFDLDGAPFAGHSTGLVKGGEKSASKLPGALLGKQIKDFEPHELDITVRLQGDTATITTLLDARPFHEWSGPTAALSQLPFWASPPGRLAIGAMSADWTVTGMRVRRLEE